MVVMRIFSGTGAWRSLQAFGALWTSPKADGVVFEKKLGTGGGQGFSLWPDFKTYAVLTAYSSAEWAQADRRFDANQGTDFHFRQWYLEPVLGHGTWGGQQPFVFGPPLQPHEQVAVLTRASISRWKWPLFWMRVGRVGQIAAQWPGLLFAKGVGEYPLLEQATFSVWQNQEALKAFAYQGQHHAKVIRQTRKIQWYREEMFVRFRVLDATAFHIEG
jgi:hypothetical protein